MGLDSRKAHAFDFVSLAFVACGGNVFLFSNVCNSLCTQFTTSAAMGKRGRPKQVRIATQVCVDFVPRTVTVASTGKKDSRLSAPIPDSNVIRQYDPIGDFKPYIADVEGKLTDHVFEKGNPLRIWFRCQLLHNGQVHKTFPVFKSKGQLTFICKYT